MCSVSNPLSSAAVKSLFPSIRNRCSCWWFSLTTSGRFSSSPARGYKTGLKKKRLDGRKRSNTCTAAVPVRRGNGTITSCGILCLITCSEIAPRTWPWYMRINRITHDRNVTHSLQTRVSTRRVDDKKRKRENDLLFFLPNVRMRSKPEWWRILHELKKKQDLCCLLLVYRPPSGTQKKKRGVDFFFRVPPCSYKHLTLPTNREG